MVELSKKIESLVTHAVLSKKEPLVSPNNPLTLEAGSSEAEKLGDPPQIYQTVKVVNGKVLALEKLGLGDPWRVREVDGVACELVCAALQEVYPHLSFSEAMRHLEIARYDFEIAAKSLLTIPAHLPYGADKGHTDEDSEGGQGSAIMTFPGNMNELVQLVTYLVLLIATFVLQAAMA